MLSDAELALHSELSLTAVLRTLVERATVLTDARRGAVGVLDRSGADFEHSVGSAELLRALTADNSDGTTLAAAIVIRGVPHARLVLADKRNGDTFSREDGEAVLLLAEHAAVAIENARRYESAIRWLEQLEALSEIGNALAGELDLPRLLAAVTERLCELLSASAAFVFLPTSDGDLEVRAAAGDQPLLVGSRLPRKGSKAGHVFDRARSERVDMMIEDVEVYQPVARQMNARAGLFVPLLSDNGAMGVIAAVNKLGDDTFSEADLRLAETYAARVVVAVRLAAGAGEKGAAAPLEDPSDPAGAGLTAREIEVLRLVAYGMSDAQIAEKLVVSQRTVHSHLRSIYRKLQVGSRSEATLWAVKRRLV
jgi:DNA-binding NarL/FixJ family response regulator